MSDNLLHAKIVRSRKLKQVILFGFRIKSQIVFMCKESKIISKQTKYFLSDISKQKSCCRCTIEGISLLRISKDMVPLSPAGVAGSWFQISVKHS